MTQPSAAEIEGILAPSYGDEVRVRRIAPIAPWSVARCELTGACPASAVVKWLRRHPTGFRTDPDQVHTEIASLRFLDGRSIAPRLLGYDAERAVVVLEDLAPRQPLDALTRRDGPAAWVEGRRELVRLTARMQAATAGREEEFLAVRRALGPFDPARRRRHFAGGLDLTPVAEMLGVTLCDAAEKELAEIRRALDEPGGLSAFSSGDQGDNNVLVHDRPGDPGGRLIDFEFGGYHHALLDLAWVHIPPPRWITIAGPAARELEALYRHAVAEAFPPLADDEVFDRELTLAAITLALERLGCSRLGTLDARRPGDDSRVQMVATYESAAALANARRCWSHVAGWLRTAAAALRRRWPDADVDLISYPSYTPRR